MTSIKQTNSMFRSARHHGEGGKVNLKEAKHIAKALAKGGLSAAEAKTVAAQLRANGDTFTASAKKELGRSTSASAQTGTGAANNNPAPQPGRGGNVEDQAIAAIGKLEEPKVPGENATDQELAQYEKDSKRYDRMMELMSNVIKQRDELKKAFIRNM